MPTFSEITSIYDQFTTLQLLKRLPADIAYQEVRVAVAQSEYEQAVDEYSTAEAKELSIQYAKSRLEKYTAQEAKALAETVTIPLHSKVIAAKLNYNKAKLKFTFLDNLFTAQRKIASLTEAEIRSSIS